MSPIWFTEQQYITSASSILVQAASRRGWMSIALPWPKEDSPNTVSPNAKAKPGVLKTHRINALKCDSNFWFLITYAQKHIINVFFNTNPNLVLWSKKTRKTILNCKTVFNLVIFVYDSSSALRTDNFSSHLLAFLRQGAKCVHAFLGFTGLNNAWVKCWNSNTCHRIGQNLKSTEQKKCTRNIWMHRTPTDSIQWNVVKKKKFLFDKRKNSVIPNNVWQFVNIVQLKQEFTNFFYVKK